MTLGETEFMPLDLGLKIILWIEVIVYLTVGIIHFFSPDCQAKPAHLKNSFEFYKYTVDEQIHACLAFILGYTALQGLVAGHVTLFELEMAFVLLGMLMAMVWPVPPGLWKVYFLKPESYLTLVMWVFYWKQVRWPVLLLAGVFNVYGVYKKLVIIPKLWKDNSYESVRKDAVETLGTDDKTIKAMDKLAGYTAARELSQPILVEP